MPVTPAGRSFAIPICSACGSKCQRDAGKWVCFACADRWLQARAQAARKVKLPPGVKDGRPLPSFKDVYPNRRARRAAARAA